MGHHAHTASLKKGPSGGRSVSRRLPGYVALSLAAWLAGPRAGLAQSHRTPYAALNVGSMRPAYPTFRPLVIQSNVVPSRRMTTQYQGVNLTNAEASPSHQTRIMGVLPVLVTRPLVLMAGFNYLHEEGNYSRPLYKATLKDSTSAYTRKDMALSLTAIHQDSLFQRPITYMFAVTGLSRTLDWPEKLTGRLTVLLMLRSTPITKLGVGLNLVHNPSIKLPVTPMVTYWHRFARSAWEVDVVLPSRAHLRRPLLANKCWLSLGTDILNVHSFGSGTLLEATNTFETSAVSVQTGALFEYAVNPYFLVGIRGGIDTPMSIWASQKDSSHKLIEATAENAAYVGLNLALTMPARKR